METIAENYQLKWHSFGTYLHSCIATSLQNESFADVALVTIDGRQIMAHRFVLSACSQYLHQILKLQPRVTTALPLMIILPPEINYRTMKTLIQYMYSGEATVSKDILEPVLRGGDILKVKGLWRPKEDENNENRLVRVSNNQAKDKPKTSKPEQPQNKERDSPNPNPSNAAAPKVLNYTINVMKTYEGKTEAKDKQAVGKDGDKKNKPKPNQQNSVIKSTEEEKRTQESETKSTESSEEGDKPDQSNDTLQFLVIKEEPIEWSEVNEADMELVDEKEVFSTEMTIKPEIYMEDSEEQGLYSPLTCELCTETFTLPAEWVRHVQTHTDMLPAKRQRRGKSLQDDDSDAPYPQLHCDLCQKYFPTPAEWVHHIQNTHTEFELHLSNKTAPGKVIKTPRSFGPAQNSCTICSKKFPSHASLLIHKRTHTGEKPYMCELCYKGFNVKSNLLRHLRTVHDKIINPTEVDDGSKEDTTGD
ncbi:zinc finger protein 3 -like, partial [Asbolus verrucosus]